MHKRFRSLAGSGYLFGVSYLSSQWLFRFHEQGTYLVLPTLTVFSQEARPDGRHASIVREVFGVVPKEFDEPKSRHQLGRRDGGIIHGQFAYGFRVGRLPPCAQEFNIIEEPGAA